MGIHHISSFGCAQDLANQLSRAVVKRGDSYAAENSDEVDLPSSVPPHLSESRSARTNRLLITQGRFKRCPEYAVSAVDCH